ncbi:uncharacterized protein METZ01_LOCUS81260 [marine metagenome]|uniref:Uncharacterized protein n=1 Tax=marine metagenome TaxID=408172 RepID=A0A381UJN9_9ZZZZ
MTEKIFRYQTVHIVSHDKNAPLYVLK